MSSLNALLRPALQTSRRPSSLLQLRQFASEANIDHHRPHYDDDPFFQELSRPTARPRPSSVAASKRETRSVYDGLQEILKDMPSTSSRRDSEQLLSAVLDLNQFPTQRKLAEKAARRQTFQALDAELDRVQEELAGRLGSHQIWTYAAQQITQAQNTTVASEVYPQLVQLLFDRLPTHLQLPFFKLVATISTESFVYGCTSQLFARVVRLQWQHYTDVQAVHETLNTMLDAGISLNSSIRNTVEEIRLAVEADSHKATNELLEVAPPPSSPPTETLLDAKQLIRRQRFGPADQEATQAMLQILMAELFESSEQADFDSNSLSFEGSDSHSQSIAPEEPSPSASFDAWLQDAMKLQQKQHGAQIPSRSRYADSHGIYLHPRRAHSST